MNVVLPGNICGLCFLFISALAMAQNQTHMIENIVVVAHPLSGEGLSQAVDVLEGKELERKLGSNIGTTLARQPGIHSASFGNAVGRPVIHGLSGPRVKIMEDRIDTLDVSVTSGDHAVGVEPFVAERIEVLKGASTLLYGSGAIGGVVDIHTARIPHNVPDNGLSGGIETRFNDNTNGNTTAVKFNGGMGQFAWHLDGTRKEGDDYEISGFAESDRLRASEDAEDEEEVRGVLPGSFFDSKAAAAGASYLADWGFVGVSVSTLDSEYGLPGGHEHHDEAEETAVVASTPTLELEQIRTDFELGIKNPFGHFDSLNLRVGFNDYEHQEIEPTGDVATDFANKAWESRAELMYQANTWKGVLGFQLSSRKFSAVGEEAFIPPVDTIDSGVFWVGERSFDMFDFETGLRLGYLEHDSSAGSAKDFLTFATSVGVVIPLLREWHLGLIADYSSRAPVAEELYSRGPHLVTSTFERGNPNLDNEKVLNLSAMIQFEDDLWSATITAYYTQFTDFIYQQVTGQEEDTLPVVAYRQDNARFFGLDAELGVTFARWEGGEVRLKGVFDIINAKFDVSGNDYLPRTPPRRLGLGLDARWGYVNASIDYLQVDKQEKVTSLELVTDSYNDLTAYVEFELPMLNASSLSIFLQGKNLTNDEQRIHTSFIKEFSSAPGRTIEAGFRLTF